MAGQGQNKFEVKIKATDMDTAEIEKVKDLIASGLR